MAVHFYQILPLLLNEQIDVLKEATVENDEAKERKKNRLRMLEEALNKAFLKLNDLSK